MSETPRTPDEIAADEQPEVTTTTVQAADLADKYDQMLRLADLFDTTGDDLRSRARLGDEVLRDEAVAESADLSPLTYRTAEDEIRSATTGKHGLLTRGVELDADALMVRATVPTYLENRRWLTEAGRNGKPPRTPTLVINTIIGVLRACQRGIGIALLPDYLVEQNGGLVQLFGETDTPAVDAYFVYPEELKSVARVQVFRDFLVSNAQRWSY